MSTNQSAPCPYKGLQPYTEADREYFFGRESDLEVIASNLSIAPLTILYGASGVGKSSVLQAGAIPHLKGRRNTAIIFFNSWQGESFGQALNNEVLRAVSESTGKTTDGVLQELSDHLDKSTSETKRLPLDELIIACARAFRLSVLIIFDQFEEYFLYHVPSVGSKGFDAEFARVVNAQEPGVNFMLSMREEELGKLDRFRARIPNLLSNLLRLEHLSLESAIKAIREPLRIYNAKYPDRPMGIEDNLVKAILEVRPEEFASDEVARPLPPLTDSDPKIETPFLQIVLTRLWEAEMAEGSRLMRLSTLERLGGAKQIAGLYLEEVMSKLDDDERASAAAVLRFLVTPKGSKIALEPAALASFADLSEPKVSHILSRLSSGQDMLVLRKVSVPGQSERYELFHDVLGPAILKWRTRYVTAQRQAQELADRERGLAAERRRANRLRLILIGLAALLVLMLGLTVLAYDQSRKAKQAREEARHREAEAIAQRQLANQRESEALEQRRLADVRAEQIKTEKEKTEDALEKAKVQTALALTREAEVRVQKGRAEGQAALANKRLDLMRQALEEKDPEQRELILQKGVGGPRLNAEQERRKREAEVQASRAGRMLVRNPPQYGLKLWANGATLRIKFLDGKAADREFVRRIAPEWTRYANLHFEFVSTGPAEIRVSFKEPYSYSFLGADALGISADQPTIMLGAIVGLSEEDKRRTVLHEFGHVLGLIEETHNPNANIPWDMEALYRYFQEKYGMDKFNADAYIAKARDIEYREFDPKSIMMVPVPKEITGGRFEAVPGSELSEGDKAFVRKLYPPS